MKPIQSKRSFSSQIENYGSKTYSDEEVTEILANLRSPRPFIKAIFDGTDVTEQILLDSGASVNLMAASLLDDIQRAKQKSYVMYRSSAVISRIGTCGPEVMGVVIINTKLGNITVGNIPYLIVSKVTETTACLLGCKSLCKMNLTMKFNQNNTISSTVDMHGSRLALPIELLTTEVYTVFLCQDTMILPNQTLNLILSTEKIDDFQLQSSKQQLEIAPHDSLQDLNFYSLGAINKDGKISTCVHNTSNEPIYLPQYSEIGLCSIIDEKNIKVSDVLLTDTKALNNKILDTCPCKLEQKIFFTTPDGSTGFEPKFTLLSPYSSKPPNPGLHMYLHSLFKKT